MRVIAANSAPCLRCYHCRRGQENLCDDLLFNNGAYADYMRIPGRIVVENMLEVPHSVDDQSAALAEPLACVLRGIHEMEVRTGDTAAVIGCGPIGLKFVRMLSRRGVRVIAHARRNRSCSDSLFRNKVDFSFSSHATVLPRSAGSYPTR